MNHRVLQHSSQRRLQAHGIRKQELVLRASERISVPEQLPYLGGTLCRDLRIHGPLRHLAEYFQGFCGWRKRKCRYEYQFYLRTVPRKDRRRGSGACFFREAPELTKILRKKIKRIDKLENIAILKTYFLEQGRFTFRVRRLF